MERPKSKKIFVTIQAGRGEVCDETVPAGFEVEILNLDLLARHPEDEIAWWSNDLREYWLENHRSWGRCEANCPCKRISKVKSYRDS